MGLGMSARPARAGCHVADAPATLGLLLDRLAEPLAKPMPAPAPTPGQVAPAPCRDEHPAPSASPQGQGPSASLATGWELPPVLVGSFPARPAPVMIAQSRPGRVERPPRLATRS